MESERFEESSQPVYSSNTEQIDHLDPPVPNYIAPPPSESSFPWNVLSSIFGTSEQKSKPQPPRSPTYVPPFRTVQKSPEQSSKPYQQPIGISNTEGLPAKLPKMQDVPSSFPRLGGYTQGEITSSENLCGSKYDLGKDGAFSDYSVLVMMFIGFLDPDWPNCAGAALKEKGFNVTYCTYKEVEKFLTLIRTGKYNVVWILSSGGGYVDSWTVDSQSTFLKDNFKEQFISAVVDYHKSGGGLFLWGDNEPYYYEMNLILQQIAKINDDEKKPSYIQFGGNTHADKVLSYGDPTKPGEFDKEHLVFSGINYLYEGVTICYPVIHSSTDDSSTDPSAESVPKTVGEYDVLATSSNGKPVILKIEKKNGCGRVIIDSGWTKLYNTNWKSVGQSRYVVNACVWLMD